MMTKEAFHMEHKIDKQIKNSHKCNCSYSNGQLHQ